MTARLYALPLVLASLLAHAGAAVGAQPTPAAPAQAATPPVAPEGTSPAPSAYDSPALVQPQPAQDHKDARIEHLVTEDSQVRIEETRVRGVTTRIVVHSKIPGVADYEIQPRNPAVGPENDHAAGMRLFNFKFGGS